MPSQRRRVRAMRHSPLPARGWYGILAILLTEAGDPLARRDYAALQTLSGVAPVTKRSGKTHIAVMRYAAQVRLRQAVFHWARRRHSARPQEPLPLPGPAATWPLLQPRPAHCRRPAAGDGLRPLATAGAVRPRSWPGQDSIDHGYPLVRLQRPSLRPDRLAAQRRAPALSGRPRRGTGAQRPGQREHGAMLDTPGSARHKKSLDWR
jgi:Transposase IS116/IS110/IS902 family